MKAPAMRGCRSPLADDNVALGPGLLHVAVVRADGQRGVVWPVVDRWHGGYGSFGIRGDGQGIVLDLDGHAPVGRGIGALGEHDGNTPSPT